MAVIKINTEQFRGLVQGDVPVLVEFMAPWCGYCRRIAPALEQAAAEQGDSLVMGQVDIDEEPQLAREEKIQVVPTFVLYRGGRRLGTLTAPDSKAGIDGFIRENLNGSGDGT